MFPFDRLIRAMDAWAAASRRGGAGADRRRRATSRRTCAGCGGSAARDYAAAIAAAELVVAHAGMGSVVAAGEHGKPIVLLPRRARLGEQSNDHQLDTAQLAGAPARHPRGRGRGRARPAHRRARRGVVAARAGAPAASAPGSVARRDRCPAEPGPAV